MPRRRFRASILFALLPATALGQDESTAGRMALAFHQTGSAYERAGRIDDAELYYVRSIEAWEKAYGPGHPGVARLLNILASSQLAAKRYGKAERTSERSLRVQASSPGVMPEEDHAIALVQLGAARAGLGKYEQAESAYLEAEAILQRARGPASPALADVWNNLGALHAKRKEFAKASLYLERSLRIQGDACSRESASTAANMAAVAAADRRFHDAEQAIRRGIGCAGEAFGPEDSRTAEMLSGYGSILRGMNRKSEAERVESQAAAIRAKAQQRNQTALTVDARELQAATRKPR